MKQTTGTVHWEEGCSQDLTLPSVLATARPPLPPQPSQVGVVSGKPVLLEVCKGDFTYSRT